MGLHSEHCAGCGVGVTGFYWPDVNWDLCVECYKMTKETEAESQAEYDAEEKARGSYVST